MKVNGIDWRCDFCASYHSLKASMNKNKCRKCGHRVISKEKLKEFKILKPSKTLCPYCNQLSIYSRLISGTISVIEKSTWKNIGRRIEDRKLISKKTKEYSKWFEANFNELRDLPC